MPRPGNYNGPEIDPEGPSMEFRSNLFYNWGRSFAGYDEDEAARISYAFIDNAYVAGPDSLGQLAFRERNRLARAWFAGNSMNGIIPASWSLVHRSIPDNYRLTTPPEVAPVAPDPRLGLTRVLARAGAWPRDAATRASSPAFARAGPRHRQSARRWAVARTRPGAALADRDGDGHTGRAVGRCARP